MKLFGHTKRYPLPAVLLALLLALTTACAAPAASGVTQAAEDAATVAAVAVTGAGVDTTDSAVTAPAVETPAAVTSPEAVAATGSATSGSAADEDAATGSEKSQDKSDKESKEKEKKKKEKAEKEKAGKEKSAETSGGDKAKEEKKEKPKETKITVAVSVDCKTLAASDPEMAALVSSDGVILGKKNVTVKKDATVYDVLKASGVSCVGKEYISTIGGLSEFDAGPESGWVFLVSGVYAGVGVTKYTVKDGDYVQFRYTLNTGADVQ
jgi:type IV secretory pathway VirB10-like protein